jgi:hypothetical protein
MNTDSTKPSFQTFIVQGQAIITSSGLRCNGPRLKQPDQACNKLLVKKNSLNQISGCFLCDRCKQEIEVVTRQVTKDSTK